MMRVLWTDHSGKRDVLKEIEAAKPIIKDDEVLIKVAAAGVNRSDSWQRGRNWKKTNPFIGSECSGEIIDIGKKVTSRKIGDKVCALLDGRGRYAEFVNVPEILTTPVPKGISLIDAASLLQSSCLVWHALSELHKTTRGQKILIHHANWSSGVIAIQYARHLGCEVFVTSGSEETIQTCKNLGARVCINYRKEDFCKRVKAETKGKGVDIVLDVEGYDWYRRNLDCLAFGGSFISIGYRNENKFDLDLKQLEEKEITYIGASIWIMRMDQMRILLNDVEKHIWPLVVEGHIIPVIGHAYKFSEAEDAVKAMAKFVLAGKSLFVP